VKALLPVLLSLCAGTAFAQAKPCEWYKFVNDENVTVIAYSIPPSLVHKGYTCIAEDGGVIRVVPRELTREEIANRDKEIAKQKADDAAGVARARKDQELTKLYASPKDVEEARDRKVLSIETAMATTKSNIERLKLQKQRLEQQAADREREGLAPSPDILDSLKNLETQIADKEHEVAARKTEKQQVIDQFQLDLERIKLLYGLPSDAPKGGTAPASSVSKNEAQPLTATAKSETPN
jgi:hypothetical protein